jgi:hypothetical protein
VPGRGRLCLERRARLLQAASLWGRGGARGRKATRAPGRAGGRRYRRVSKRRASFAGAALAGEASKGTDGSSRRARGACEPSGVRRRAGAGRRASGAAKPGHGGRGWPREGQRAVGPRAGARGGRGRKGGGRSRGAGPREGQRAEGGGQGGCRVQRLAIAGSPCLPSKPSTSPAGGPIASPESPVPAQPSGLVGFRSVHVPLHQWIRCPGGVVPPYEHTWSRDKAELQRAGTMRG